MVRPRLTSFCLILFNSYNLSTCQRLTRTLADLYYPRQASYLYRHRLTTLEFPRRIRDSVNSSCRIPLLIRHPRQSIYLDSLPRLILDRLVCIPLHIKREAAQCRSESARVMRVVCETFSKLTA
ncbi:hypothetical protein F4813DRAFT_43500 [Daldinia decipiens]|uniref:uncharacterized protein n=1 Tax=Daldinia decipiens TaxID=326647 RepID=UPI0020C5AD60|nr:uncharacterized protein F4813DRAFT_43500 [Daldinia decipiens]KAI1658745.1 hypothetical protein F4813DRAFT_43500 [Daldinia decipiens]